MALLAACAAPANSNTPPPPQASDTSATPADPSSARSGSPPQLDYSCSSNADCAVKNVGNCCGAMPACVNKDSPTDPAAVSAQCARRGMMGVCGFREISACQCSNGRCEEAAGSGQLLRKPARPSVPVR
ncbi:hypothetical protein [Luteimonas cucumeris]